MDETCEVNTAPMATGRDDPRTGRAAGPHASTSTTPGSAPTIGTHTSPPAATQTVSTLRNDVSDQRFKTIIVPCKRCAQEFELRLPMHYYETMVAIAEEDGDRGVHRHLPRLPRGRSILADAGRSGHPDHWPRLRQEEEVMSNPRCPACGDDLCSSELEFYPFCVPCGDKLA
jgi:hypothetical protein